MTTDLPRKSFPAACAALALLLTGCGRQGTPADQIVVLIESPLPRLDPRFAMGSWETRVSRLVAPGLTGLKDLGLGPSDGLAESIVREDDVTYLARLRSGARFPDGRAVDAEDVRYTFESIRQPALGSPFRKSWEDILARVEIVDARTVRFHLVRPRAPFVSDLEVGIVDRRAAEPVDQAVINAAKQGLPPPVLNTATEVVGAGPYRIVARGADFVSLEANSFAYARAATPRLSVRTIRDDNSRVLALMGGSADVIENGGITPLVLETLEADPKLEVRYGKSATITYLGFNMQDPVLRDVRVRQAIALAIDRERIVAAKFRGRAVIATSLLDTANPYYEPGVRKWPFDPAAARKLLDEAGYPDPDGDGPLPRLTLTWKTSAMRFRVALVQVMARQLGDVGIAVDVRPFEFATFMDDVRKGNFQLFALQLTDVVEPDYLRAVLHSSRIPTPANSFGGTNRFRYQNREVDGWLDQGAATADVAVRRAMYANVQRVLAQEMPLFPLWHEDNILVHRRELRDVALLKTGRFEGLLGAHKVAVHGHGGN